MVPPVFENRIVWLIAVMHRQMRSCRAFLRKLPLLQVTPTDLRHPFPADRFLFPVFFFLIPPQFDKVAMNFSRISACLSIAMTALTVAMPAMAAVSPAPGSGASAATPAPTPKGPDSYDPTRPFATPDSPPGALDSLPPRVPVAPAASPIQKRIGPAPVRSATNSFLWEVKSPTATVWLFGTMHVGKQSFYPLSEAVESAFDQSAKLVVEADIGGAVLSAEMDALISYPPPDALDKHIPKPLYARLKTQLARLNMPEEVVKPMKPFVVGGFLSVMEFSRFGYDMNLGVDAYLLARAKEAGKPVGELESMTAQLKMMNNMPAKLQEDFLENAIAALELGRAAEQVTGMVNAWQTGDGKLMADVTADVNRGMKSIAQLDDIMLHGRHEAMLKKIEGYLAAKAVHFVAVGSLHLVGPRGLVQMLKTRGYEVTQK